MGLTKQQFTMVAVLLAGTLLAVLNQTFLSPALPVIMVDLNISPTTVQWLTSGYSLIEAIIIPLSAFFIGRFSTRQLFIGGIGLFACGSLLAAVAPAFPLLLIGRMMQAAATGVVMPMVVTLIMLIFPREKRGSAMGIITLIISFAPAVGPSLSGVLIDSLGWRSLFIIVTALAVIVVLFAIKALTNFGGFERSTFDGYSVVLSSLGMVALLYGLSTFTSATDYVLTAVLIVVGIVLLGLFVRRQLKLDEPLLKVDILKVRNYRNVVIVIATLQAALIGLSVILPLYVQNVLGLSATMTGLIMLPGAVLGALAGLVAGKLFDRFGVRHLVLIGGFLMAVGTLGILFFGIDTPAVFVMAVYTLLGFSLQMVITPMNTWGINSLDNQVIQHASALSNTLNQVGGSFGTALIVSMTALSAVVAPQASGVEMTFMGDYIAFCVAAGILFVCFLLMVVFIRDRKGERATVVTDGSLSDDRSSSTEKTWRVGDIMNKQADFVLDTATIRQALKIFATTETSGIPIVDGKGSVVGFISDGDIMKYLGTEDAAFVNTSLNIYRVIDNEKIQESVYELLKLNVMRIATKKAITVDESMSLEKACGLLAEKKIKKVPVVQDGKLVGVLSRRNVISAIAQALPESV